MAKIVYRIVCGEGKHQPQFDEQWRLVAAASEPEAYAKATLLGKKEQESFFNEKRERVQWLFINVPELFSLSLSDGLEQWSRIREAEDADAYIRQVNNRAEMLVSSL